MPICPEPSRVPISAARDRVVLSIGAAVFDENLRGCRQGPSSLINPAAIHHGREMIG
jgi:hypothetical protein